MGAPSYAPRSVGYRHSKQLLNKHAPKTAFCLGRPVLTRRPVHGPSTQQVQMQMVDCLATIIACIHHRAEAFAKALLLRDLLCNSMQMSQNPLVTGREMRKGRNVFARDQQHMHGSLRSDVGKGERVVIFIKLLRRYLPGGDFAKQTIHVDQLIAALFLEPKPNG